jgi:hypothetical protein
MDDEFYRVDCLIKSIDMLESIKFKSFMEMDDKFLMQYSAIAKTWGFYFNLPHSLPETLVDRVVHHRIVNRNQDNEFRMLSLDLSDKFWPVALYVYNPDCF